MAKDTEYARTYKDRVDTDRDGLPDVFEKEIGTDPNNRDSDGDGLKDREEIDLHTDPLDRDTDDDTIDDWAEVTLKTDPENADTDGDGWEDGWEIATGQDPSNDKERPTTKSDRDFQEIAQQKHRRSEDRDQDGIPNDVEAKFGTDPDDFDTDRDGLGDGVEAGRGTDPANPYTHHPHNSDTLRVTPGEALKPKERFKQPDRSKQPRAEADTPGGDPGAAATVTAGMAAGGASALAADEGFASFTSATDPAPDALGLTADPDEVASLATDGATGDTFDDGLGGSDELAMSIGGLRPSSPYAPAIGSEPGLGTDGPDEPTLQTPQERDRIDLEPTGVEDDGGDPMFRPAPDPMPPEEPALQDPPAYEPEPTFDPEPTYVAAGDGGETYDDAGYDAGYDA